MCAFGFDALVTNPRLVRPSVVTGTHLRIVDLDDQETIVVRNVEIIEIIPFSSTGHLDAMPVT